MSISLSRAVALQSRIETSLADVMSAAEIYGSTSAAMEKLKHDRLDMLGRKRWPRWLESYASGYWRALCNEAYRSKLVHGGWIDGKFYSTHSSRDDYYEKQGIGAKEFSDLLDAAGTGGHYWQRNLRPYFTSVRDDAAPYGYRVTTDSVREAVVA